MDKPSPTNAPDLRAWIGRSETLQDHAHATPATALMATLDRDGQAFVPGTPLPIAALRSAQAI